VTVAICTVRAGPDLAEAVATVLPQLGAGELVVVRSGQSQAEVPSVLEPLDPRVRVVAEPRRSSSAARTAALTAARAEVVLFIDDDCLASPGWVDALSHAMAPSEVAAAGGTILPIWPAVRPGWLHDRLAASYGERVAGATEHGPFAANMAVRVAAVAAAGGIDPDLGHRDGVPGLHEETELAARLAASGCRVVEVPAAVVEHRVRPEQARRRWLLRRSWHEGRSDAVVDARHGRDDRMRRLAKLAGLALVALPAQARPRAGTYVLARAAVNAGYLLERRRPRIAGPSGR